MTKAGGHEAAGDALLERILRAPVYDVAVETPLEPAPLLSERLDNRVWIKREDLQPVFSFKLRGAYNRLRGLTDAERKAILDRTRAFARNGEHELFKSTNRFDGAVGRKLHGV